MAECNYCGIKTDGRRVCSDECADAIVQLHEDRLNRTTKATLCIEGRFGPYGPIQVWRFEDAPDVPRDLSEHGGDEDWIAAVPPALTDEYISWLQSGGPFGCCEVSEHKLHNGWVIHIGAHA